MHALAGPTWSASSDIYAKETDKTLESHSSLAVSLSEQSSQTKLATSRSNSTSSSQAQAVLKNINEDLDRLRLNMRRASSSGTKLHTSLSSQKSDTLSPTEPGPQIIHSDDEDHRESFESAPFNVTYDYMVPLPKHSVCVDSGLVMEEDTFCPPEDEKAEEDTDKSTTFSSESTESRRKLTRADNVAEQEDTTGFLVTPEHSLDQYLDKIEPATEISMHAEKVDNNWNVTTTVTNNDTNVHKPIAVEGIPDAQKSGNQREDNSKVTCDEPIEPLLSSKTVNLKTKLKCLADLYTTEETEQAHTLIPHELPYPYSVFNNNRLVQVPGSWIQLSYP